MAARYSLEVLNHIAAGSAIESLGCEVMLILVLAMSYKVRHQHQCNRDVKTYA